MGFIVSLQLAIFKKKKYLFRKLRSLEKVGFGDLTFGSRDSDSSVRKVTVKPVIS